MENMWAVILYGFILCLSVGIVKLEKEPGTKTSKLADDALDESETSSTAKPGSSNDDSSWNPKGVKLSDSPADWPGHLKPFGSTGRSRNVDIYKKYPKPAFFFSDYVEPYIPLLMKNASHLNNAYAHFKNNSFFTKWPQSRFHWVPSSPTTNISFHHFIQTFEEENRLFFDELPFFLGDHVTVPSPLLCNSVIKEFVNNLLYIGPNDRKNSIEQRSVDTIRCVYAGKQDIVLVSQLKYGSKMPKDFREVDVNHVDYTKYPDMREVEYVKATLNRGDCLYLPNKWYWQVSSYSSSKSVDVLWNHNVKKVDPYECSPSDSEMKMSDFKFLHMKSWSYAWKHIALYYFASYLAVSDTYDVRKLSLALSGDKRIFKNLTSWTEECSEIAQEILQTLDVDRDGNYTLSDLDVITPKKADEMQGQLEDRVADFQDIMNDQQRELKEAKTKKQLEESSIMKPGVDPKLAVENYINNYMQVLEDVITESMAEMERTGKMPDFKQKMSKRQAEIDGDVPFQAKAKPPPPPTVSSKPTGDGHKEAKEKAKAKIKEQQEKRKTEEPESEEYSTDDAYAVVDDSVEEEILADEDDEEEIVKTEQRKPENTKPDHAKKVPKQDKKDPPKSKSTTKSKKGKNRGKDEL